MKSPKPSPWLILLSVGAVCLLVWRMVLPYFLCAPRPLPPLFALALFCAITWTLILWWALHQMFFELAGLLGGKPEASPPVAMPVRFVVLYLTCDDFLPDCCLSCLKQDYPAQAFRVAVCDDSRSARYRAEVADFCEKHEGLTLLRRTSLGGGKAGNLNYAFSQVADGQCDWVVIVDADQELPSDYLTAMASSVASRAPDVAFVQAGRQPFGTERALSVPNTAFQDAMESEMLMFWERSMRWRQRLGFLPFFGHGGAIRQEAWKRVGGFPLAVSEDFAFALEARGHGFRGERDEGIRAWEAYPKDFGAFLIRITKYSGGAAELLRRFMPGFLLGGASVTEKIDAVLQLATYLLMPLALVNLWISTYLCHYLRPGERAQFSPWAPYLFLGMFLLAFPVLVSVQRSVVRALRHWFWAFSIYAAALPPAAMHFLMALVRRPIFRRTPKGWDSTPTDHVLDAVLFLLGLCGLGFAWFFWSPFSPILAATATAHVCVPLYRWLHKGSSFAGRLSRLIIYLPGMLFIVGLVMMWLWAID